MSASDDRSNPLGHFRFNTSDYLAISRQMEDMQKMGRMFTEQFASYRLPQIDFAEQLKKMRPAPEALALFREIVLDKWKEQYKTLADETTQTTKEVLALRERKAKLFSLIEQSADCPELVDDLKKQYREVNKELTLATTEESVRFWVSENELL